MLTVNPLSARAASLQLLNKNDPLDQKLEAVLAPTADPVLSYISKSPALSGAIVSLLGQYPNLLSALEAAAVPILDGFNALILGNGNPLSQAIGGAASSNPLADEVLGELQQVTNVTSPLAQALTVRSHVLACAGSRLACAGGMRVSHGE